MLTAPSGQLHAEPFDQYPTRGDHEARWAALARAIAAERDRISDDPATMHPPETPGELIVIGSGIEAVGFTATDEMLIREADEVFFCVADPATSVWIKANRPDAYDLYVLYDDTKLRYLTYMEMTEALLHFVRKGRKVVAIYYGHPGIFVLSTHRAIQIARREGHRAVMRAAVSALDTLCADLGVDPSQPGMQTFEATDMLIRGRRPDPSLHLVLWQVGLIGELGYRRRGYLNSGFSILLDYLEETYGPDHRVVNYIGSRYPAIAPLTQWETIASLRDPDVQATVTGISTFYVPPKEARAADPAMLETLGLLKPGQSTRTPTTPLREIDRYGPREMRAFDDLASFRVPMGYHWQEDTAAARFILALRDDGALRDQYVREPAVAVAAWGDVADLSPRDRSLLARRDANLMQVAAKGLRARATPNAERLLRDLLTRSSTARGLRRAVRSAGPAGAIEALDQWSTRHGYAVDWSTMSEELDLTLRTTLYPWNGFYLAADRHLCLFLLGRPGTPASDRIYLNGEILRGARFERGLIRWRAADGNATSGHLQVDLSPRGARRLTGMIWPARESVASRHRLTMLEHLLPPGRPLATLAGRYRIEDDAGRTVEVDVRPDGSRMRVEVDGRSVTGPVRGSRAGLEIDDRKVPLAALVREEGLPRHLRGEYLVRVTNGERARLARFTFDQHHVVTNDGMQLPIERHGETVSWSGGPNRASRGEATLLLDPITLRPMLFGKLDPPGNGPPYSLVGMVPVDPDAARALAQSPGLGLDAWAWAHLVTIATDSSRKGGLFLWHGWERAATNLRLLRTSLQEACL